MLQKFGILFQKLPADSVFFLFIHSISALKKSLCKILSKIVTVFEAFEILLFRNSFVKFTFILLKRLICNSILSQLNKITCKRLSMDKKNDIAFVFARWRKNDTWLDTARA